MIPEVWDAVVGRRFDVRPASLTGFAVYRVVDDVYPVMIAAGPTARVEGAVYLDLDGHVLTQLDLYESESYERREVEVVVGATGPRLTCQAYVLPESRRTFASDEAWDLDWFRREALAEYLARLNKA